MNQANQNNSVEKLPQRNCSGAIGTATDYVALAMPSALVTVRVRRFPSASYVQRISELPSPVRFSDSRRFVAS